MTWIEGATLAIAVLGAVLGVINTCHALWRDRVRLRVEARPSWEDGIRTWSVVVRNVAHRDVTVDVVVIQVLGRGEYWHPALYRDLPERLAAGASLTRTFPPEALENPDFPRSGRALARTGGGLTFRDHLQTFREKDDLSPAPK